MSWQKTDRAKAERTVFLGCDLSDAEIVELSTNIAASGHPGVFLLDSVAHADALRHFLHEFEPAAVVPVGKPRAGLDRRLEFETSQAQDVRGVTRALPGASKKVVPADASSREEWLQSAFQAGTLRRSPKESIEAAA